MIKGIGDLKNLIKLRKFAIRDQSKDDFIQHLIQYVPAKKWKIQTKKAKRGTDEAFFGLMKVSGTAVLKLIGIKPDDAENYMFKSIVLKEKKSLNRILWVFLCLKIINKKCLLSFKPMNIHLSSTTLFQKR